MRTTLALVMLLLAVSSAAPEPEYSSSSGLNSFRLVAGHSPAASVEINSAIGKGDRLVVAALPNPASNLAPPSEPPPPPSGPNIAMPVSLGELCNALFTSAQDNRLPVTFFANLIWQESGLQKDVVSRKGAMGIAQFMPQTAIENGLGDPFDPLRSISASARLLRDLRGQFGNLGLVAAAYNAGPRRVSDWLARGRRLPRETLSYVVNITGRSVEEWRKTPPDDASLRFVQRLPCRDMSAFAELERTQSQHPQIDPAPARSTEEDTKAPEAADATAPSQQGRLAERNHHPRNLLPRGAVHAASAQQHLDKHESNASRHRAGHERRGRAQSQG